MSVVPRAQADKSKKARIIRMDQRYARAGLVPSTICAQRLETVWVPNDMVCLWMPLSWANEVQYTGLNEAATKENDNGILCWIGRVRQRNVDLYYG